MPKQGKNPLQNYFKISIEDVSIAVCILCRKNLSRGSKDPHKPSQNCQSQSFSFGTSLVLSLELKKLLQDDDRVNMFQFFLHCSCVMSGPRGKLQYVLVEQDWHSHF